MDENDDLPDLEADEDIVFDDIESEVEEETAAAPDLADIDDFDTDEAPDFERREDGDANQLKRSIFSVPIEVTVTVGSARPLIGELLSMGRDHLLPLDSGIDDPVELRVKDRVIARGELTQSNEGDGRLGIRLTEIVELTDIIP